MKSIQHQFSLLFIFLLFSACESHQNEILQLKNENNKLKSEIEYIAQEQRSEQIAILQYIVFVDSIESSLNGIFTDYIYLKTNDEVPIRDKKRELLDRISVLKQKLYQDRTRIKTLEKQIEQLQRNQKDDYYLELIERYKSNLIKQVSQINELQYQVEELNHTIRIQEKVIHKQNYQIYNQNKVLAHTRDQLKETEELLNKNYVFLVSRSKFMKIEMDDDQLVIPQKMNRINILNEDNGLCKLEKINNKVTSLYVDQRFWNQNKILTLYLKGDF